MTVAVCLLTVFALGARAFLATRGGIWRDEALFLFIARMPTLADVFSFLHWHESHPPLFYLLMRTWMALLGTRDVVTLVPPILFGAAIVPACYAAGSHVFGRTTGLYAALFAALSFPLAQFAAYARPYALLPLLCLASLALLHALLFAPSDPSQRPTRVMVGYILATLAMIYTHNWSWLVLAASWVVIGAAFLVPASPLRQPERKRNILRWAVAQAAILACYLPWLPILLYQSRHAGHGPALTRPRLPDLYDQFAGLMLPPAGVWSGLVFPLIALALGASLYLNRRKTPPPTAASPSSHTVGDVLLVYVAVPLVALVLAWGFSIKSNLFLPRCLVMLSPPLFVASAVLIASAPLTRTIRRALIGMVTLAAILGTLESNDPQSIKSNGREVAALLAQRAQPSDRILVLPEQIGSTLNYYYQGPQEQFAFPTGGRVTYTRFDDFVDRCSAPERYTAAHNWIHEAHTQKRRLWVLIDESSYHVDFAHLEQEHPEPGFRPYLACFHRPRDLFNEANSLYGAPVFQYADQDRTIWDERIRVYLFVPPGGEQKR